MTALVWDQTGQRIYEIGIDRGVYYPQSGAGVAWDGLVSVKESADGGDITSYYLDGVKHLDVVASDDFSATLTAFSAPEEFLDSDGVLTLTHGFYTTNQPRRNLFGLSYRTKIAKDTNPDYAYKIHLIYNATAAPIEKAYATLSGQNSAPTFDWSISAVPVSGVGFKPSPHFEIRSDEMSPELLASIETILYGTTDVSPRLPTITEILNIINTGYDLITEPITEPL